MIEESVIAARMGYQLATDAMILCGIEEEGRQSHASLESMQELSKNGQGITRSVMDGFRDVGQQISKVRIRFKISDTGHLFEKKIADSTKDDTFLVVIPPSSTHSQPFDSYQR